MNPALLLLAALLLSLSIFAQPSSSEPFWTQDNAAVSLAAIDAIEPFDDPEDDADLLETVALYPNSPNPFNPETEIAFDLPSTSLVTVCVYDIVGQHVSTLVSGTLGAGHYIMRFDGSNLPAGTYFCRLTAPGVSQTRKMELTTQARPDVLDPDAVTL